MDPFTQRMLERAKLRREKLDGHLGQKTEREDRCPLKESNASVKDQTVKKFEAGIVAEIEKDKQCGITNLRKSKLQKLAQFYSGTENADNENVLLAVKDENIMMESDDQDTKENLVHRVDQKQQFKYGRFAELANKIKQWEDDLNHPKHFTGTCIDNTENKGEENYNRGKEVNKNEKQTIWDANMVDKLRSQGFSLSKNNSKLVYDFETDKKKTESEEENLKLDKSETMNLNVLPSGKNVEKQEKRSAVLQKAQAFEMTSKEDVNKRKRDPAELSLAERKAIFEKNKGETVFPKSYNMNKKESDFFHAERNVLSKVMHFQKRENKNSDIMEEVNSKQMKFDTGYDEGRIESKTENLEVLNKIEIPERTVTIRENEKGDAKIPKENLFSEKLTTIPEPPPLPQPYAVTQKTIECSNENYDEALSPKSGKLYPSLSKLDMTDESDITFSGMESNESKNSDLYLNMTLSDLLEINKNNPITPPSDHSFSQTKECKILKRMDKLLDNALNDMTNSESEEYDDDDDDQDMGPSPPKIMKNSSFEYKSNTPDNALLHTVSFYRKQQQNTNKTPEKVVVVEENSIDKFQDDALLVQDKIQALVVEVNKQQTIISQASQALNLCISTVEFSGSGEQVEGERLLLLASHKRQACLNEIQRLKVENSLRPKGESNLLMEKGDVTLTNISIRLKREALRTMAAGESLQYFVCLVKSDERVLGTPTVAARRENLKDLVLQFPGQLKLEGLYSDFKITVEVYNLELNKELLPHNVKYHINNKKEKKLLTPIKSKKSDSKLVKPNIQSPGGPNAVRTSNFQMCGYIVFSLREITRTQWILNKVPYISPLEGSISMTIQSQLRLGDEFRGFLTMFDDISGFGAWHRRWCLLSSHVISYWKYPDDEHKKVPIGTIDLRAVVTENVGLVSRDICARLHTFLLETTRPRLPDDKDSLVLNVQENTTTIRHLLSADSKQEMMDWCKKLNTILALLRSWKCNADG